MNNNQYKFYLIILSIGVTFFTLASSSFFGPLSAEISKWLYNTFGYTNKWSKSYGPSWFVSMNGNVSAFGSKEVVIIISILFFIYLIIRNRTKDAIDFITIIASGIIVIFTMKFITSTKESFTFAELYTNTLLNYPSGHSVIATVLYLTIALHLTRESDSEKLNNFYLTSVIIIILLVGISRVTGSGHTMTEVIAAWAAGISWFALITLIINYIKEIQIN